MIKQRDKPKLIDFYAFEALEFAESRIRIRWHQQISGAFA